MHNRTCWFPSFVNLSNPLSPLFLHLVCLPITVLISPILLRSRSYFPPCSNAFNLWVHSLLGRFPSSVLIFSDTRGVWLWRSRWHLSTLYKRDPLHSHIAGKFPAHGSPSCAVWYRLPLEGALVCRFWSRNDEHSRTLPCSLTIVGRDRLRVLQKRWPRNKIWAL